MVNVPLDILIQIAVEELLESGVDRVDTVLGLPNKKQRRINRL